mgnify:CR=1 FL=1
MGEKTCCVTGHRDVPVGKEQYVEEALRKEVLAAIAAGYTRFISGFADGVDLTFAAIVAAEKKAVCSWRPRSHIETVSMLNLPCFKNCLLVVIACMFSLKNPIANATMNATATWYFPRIG